MKRVFLVCVAICCVGSLRAQDVHVTQIDQQALLVSPALCGFSSKGSIQLGTRQQWKTALAPFQTQVLNGQYRFGAQGRQDHATLALGFQATLDQSGDLSLKASSLATHVAAKVPLSRYAQLGAGLYVGFGQRSIEAGGQWGSQYNGLTYDPSMNPGVFTAQRYAYSFADLGFGASYQYVRGQVREQTLSKWQSALGFYHVNRPNDAFLSATNSVGMYVRWTFYSQAEICLRNTHSALVPMLFYQQQHLAHEWVYGLCYKSYIKGNCFSRIDQQQSLQFGLFHRWNDAFIVRFGVQFKQIQAHVSYDLTLSDLSKIPKVQGAFELQLAYQFRE
ncbi:MAG: hypothetical protein RLZZ301_739 [Bacteroidota bacterium]|jgi:type IX secretion system PorP/SprF family membrane protein